MRWRNPPNDKLLVSVRDADEALIAAKHGAEIVDVKEPRHGALGFAATEGDWRGRVRRCVTKAMQQTPASVDVPISIAMGDLVDVAPTSAACRDSCRKKCGAKFVTPKWGAEIARTERWPARWEAWRSALPPHLRTVAVAYADDAVARSPLAEDVLERAIVGGAAGLLLDTFAKKSSHLFDFFSASRLDSLIQRAQRFQLLVAVAGSLRMLRSFSSFGRQSRCDRRAGRSLRRPIAKG